jgi:RNA polymerase sigma factor (TIGR02999 family)
MSDQQKDVTRLLRQGGKQGALMPLIYDELRVIAERRMGGERKGHTLQATALVHEAYMKLVDERQVAWEGRGHFYAAAAEAMRRILVDHARRVRSLKRGGDRMRVTLGSPESKVELESAELVALDAALERLAREDPRAAEVASLRFLTGLSVQETGEALGISERSVHREWSFARARLLELMAEG